MNAYIQRQNGLAMIADADRKPIQWVTRKANPDNGGTGSWDDNPSPDWDFEAFSYRPKPEPKTRPWGNINDVPGPVCWVRLYNDYCIWMITTITNGMAVFSNNHEEMFGELQKRYEYSTDRKTWHKCEVSE